MVVVGGMWMWMCREMMGRHVWVWMGMGLCIGRLPVDGGLTDPVAPYLLPSLLTSTTPPMMLMM